jgi:hypothetical protein
MISHFGDELTCTIQKICSDTQYQSLQISDPASPSTSSSTDQGTPSMNPASPSESLSMNRDRDALQSLSSWLTAIFDRIRGF